MNSQDKMNEQWNDFSQFGHIEAEVPATLQLFEFGWRIPCR